jgi:hypothetical protein
MEMVGGGGRLDGEGGGAKKRQPPPGSSRNKQLIAECELKLFMSMHGSWTNVTQSSIYSIDISLTTGYIVSGGICEYDTDTKLTLEAS